MAFYSIEKRPRADGTLRYRCTVGIKNGGKFVYRESRTFSKQALATAWGKKRMAEIEANGIPDLANEEKDRITLSELIDRYKAHETVKMSRSKSDQLNEIKKHDIADILVSDLKSTHFIEHCQAKRARGRAASTAALDIAHIGAVLKSAGTLFKIDVPMKEFSDAREWMSRVGVIAPSQRRSRRPTRNEVDALYAELEKKARTAYSGAPFHEIFMFSILTCTRIGEVCNLYWGDIDAKQKAILVRDRKHPLKKEGNNMMLPLLGEAWEILMRQPHKDERVFPYRARSITQTYRQVRAELEIEDLRYHDLRREGASRLFEMGFSIEEVAQVTGHKNLNILWQVYTELFPNSLHERFRQLQKGERTPKRKNIIDT